MGYFAILAQAETTEARPWLPIAVVAATVLLLGLVLLVPFWLRKRRRVVVPPATTLKVNVSALPEGGPPDSGPALRIYNVPVRLAMIVLAPVGRGAESPSREAIAEIIDQVVPGLGAVAAAHHATVKVWPAQLSSHGFLHQFSINVGLPGDAGKGTPWSSAVGRFDAEGTPYLAGLLLCAAKANSLGQFLVERESQWPDMLRVDAG